MRRLWRWRRRQARQPHADTAMLSCGAVVERVQLYLDGVADDMTSQQVAEHLDRCRRCGLEADLYLQIKATLSGDRAVPADAVERLRRFGERLAQGGPPDSPPA